MAEMNIAEFEDLAAAFGPDPSLWPADRRGAALAFLEGAESAAARTALAEAQALDAALAELAAAEVPATLPAGLAARILADAADVTADMTADTTAARAAPGAAAPAEAGRSWLADLADMFGGWRTAAISAAACALIGLGAGYATPEAAVASLGYEDAAQEEIIVGLGWDADEVEYSMFGDAG